MWDEFVSWYGTRLKIRAFCAAIALALVLVVTSCNELRYLAFSKRTDATVTTLWKNKEGTHFYVDYRYTEEDGTAKTGKTGVSEENVQNFVAGSKFPIAYLPGSTMMLSRPADERNWWLLIVWGVVMAFIAIQGTFFMIEFRDHERRSAKS